MPKFKKTKSKLGGTQLIIASYKGKNVEYVGVYNELRVQGQAGIAGSLNISKVSSWYGYINAIGTSAADAIKVIKALDKGFKTLKKHRKEIEAAYKPQRKK